MALNISGCGGSSATSGDESTTVPVNPSTFSAVDIPPERIDEAIGQLDSIVSNAMDKTGVPGLAVAVVHDDELVYAKGFGVKQSGSDDPVDENTVFQIASLSKPLGATVVAGVVGDGTISWDDPVVRYLPDFMLSDPYFTENVTIADFFSHRSGLPDHAGDLLQDLGYDRVEILYRLRFLPLKPFRITYQYTNMGLTAGAEAAAVATGNSWEDLCRDRLYERLGMTSTSSIYADFQSRTNKSLGNILEEGEWQPAPNDYQADVQSPAGGVSSNVVDMAKWMRMVLAAGTFDGQQVIEEEALMRMLSPQMTGTPPASISARPGFYGLGIIIGIDGAGRTRFSHSGAFASGAATAFTLLPSENLGIVVLTNGEPVGVPEAINASFIDLVETGEETFDWLELYRPVFEAMSENHSVLAGEQPPADPVPAAPDSAYTGTYKNDYYGPVAVAVTEDGSLVMRLGPDSQEFPLELWDGEVFAYYPTGENAVGISSVKFTMGPDGTATAMTIEYLDEEGLGTFKHL